MEERLVAKGAILSDNDGQRWIVGSFIGLKGIAENYEAAMYDDKTPTDYPAILQIVPQGDEPLPDGFQFYLDHAKHNALDTWKKVRHLKHLGIPVLLGTGSLNTNRLKYQFIIVERHGKDLWSLFVERDKKFEATTVYKIAVQIITILKYKHSKSFIQGDFNSLNIVVDAATQNHIYLLDYSIPSYAVNVAQIDPHQLLSRDTQMGASSKRGDMETLFYNLVQWLGIELPWEKDFENPALALKEKECAFADVEKFLQNWSNETAIPTPVCEYMKLLAKLDTNGEPKYRDFESILVSGLKQLHHVPTSKLFISKILIVDQHELIPEDNNQVDRQDKKKMVIPCLGKSVVKIANIISENCRHEGEVRLQEVGPGSLIDIICELTNVKKGDTKWKNLLVNAWETDTAGLKTTVKNLWREKESRAKGITNEAASTEAGARALGNTNNGLNHNNPDTSNSQSRCEAISPDGMSLNESLDFSNASPPNGRPAACSPSPSRCPGVQNSPHRPSTSGYSSHSSIQDDPHLENTSSSRTTEQFSDTEHYERPEVVVVKVERETNEAEVQVIECRSSESAGCESWQDKYKMLDAWLEMKEQNFDNFGSIPSEPQMMADQVQKVRILLDEIYRSLLLRQLKNAKLPSDPADTQKQLEQIECRWRDLQSKLEKRGKELGDACREKLRGALQNISDMNKLSLHNDPEEQQLSKIGILSGQLKDLQRTLLANVTTMTEQLCQSIKTPAYTSDLRVQLHLVNNFYSNLQQKIAIKKAEVESNLSRGREFDDSCKKIHLWLVKELKNIMKKPPVSTDRATLQKHHDYYKREHQRIMDRQTEMMELLEMGRNRVKSQNTTQQRFLELIESQWDSLIQTSHDIVKKLETCTESSDKFYQTEALFLRWLGEVESKLKSIKPASVDEIANQLKEFNLLRDEVHEKSSEFDQYVNLGHAFISICDDVDTDDVVKNKLDATNNRWTKLDHHLLNIQQSFEELATCFARLKLCFPR